MTDYTKISMLENYALVLPDPHLETYQFNGKNTDLLCSDFKYENGSKISIKERNASVFGTVYGVPSGLRFNLSKIEHIHRNNTMFVQMGEQKVPVNIGLHRQVAELTRASVNFDTQIEICKGDKVNFSYTAHKKATEQSLIIDTDLGEMLLIKYDMLYMVVDEKYNPKKMLNGYILVEPEQIETIKEGAQEFVDLGSGLVKPAPKYKGKKTKKSQNGIVRLSGGINSGYLLEKEKTDYCGELPAGSKIVYDPRRCQKLEFETHQIMSDKVLHLLQRKDIYGKYDELVQMIEEAIVC